MAHYEQRTYCRVARQVVAEQLQPHIEQRPHAGRGHHEGAVHVQKHLQAMVLGRLFGIISELRRV